MDRSTSGVSNLIATPKTRRDALVTAGKATAGAMLVSALGTRFAWADASGDVDIGTRCLTGLYSGGEGIHFDTDYYREHHMATVMKFYGKSIKRFEARKAVAGGGGVGQSTFAGVVNIWVADEKAFEEAGKMHGQELGNDVKNFTNGMLTMQNDVVYGEAGLGASAMKVGDRCMTILYPHSEGDHFNYDYYRDHHLTAIMKLYGPQAISRFELNKGLSSQDGSGPAPYNATVNIYIADQAAFDAAGKTQGPKLPPDVKNFSPVNPVAFPTEVFAVAEN